MSKKQKQTVRHEQPDGSTTSEETVGASEASGNQMHDTQRPATMIDPRTKAYLDMIIQSTAALMIQMVKQYMDQQFEVQREWNVQCMETINRRFEQLEKTNAGGNEVSTSNSGNSGQTTSAQQPQQSQHQNQEHEQTPNIGGSLGQIEGNCPPTPIINSLIMKASSDIQGNNKQESDGSIKYKITTRKFPAIDYTAFKQLPAVQGMNNPKAIETERIRVWWVMNWTEGQKLVKMLPQKPSLTNRVWKALAFEKDAKMNMAREHKIPVVTESAHKTSAHNTTLDIQAAEILGTNPLVHKTYNAITKRFQKLAVTNQWLNKDGSIWPPLSYYESHGVERDTLRSPNETNVENNRRKSHVYTHTTKRTYHKRTTAPHTEEP
ncbi:13072_t:CDS:2 [Gigaspora margarita]|uniref:13072_t:CDS:1 n=1 Tax=Gigaspora margarita TaxID=4874 RepID=A0ABN7VIJ5_GIGMA|nr:13072_t:CDS:2 [Gigaspora margarita]